MKWLTTTEQRAPIRPREPFMSRDELLAKLRLESTATQDAIVELLAQMEEAELTNNARPDVSVEDKARAMDRIYVIRELQDRLVLAIQAAKAGPEAAET